MVMRMYPGAAAPSEAPNDWPVGGKCRQCEHTKLASDTDIRFKYWNQRRQLCFGCAYCESKGAATHEYAYFCNACGGKQNIFRQLTTYDMHRCNKAACQSLSIPGFD